MYRPVGSVVLDDLTQAVNERQALLSKQKCLGCNPDARGLAVYFESWKWSDSTAKFRFLGTARLPKILLVVVETGIRETKCIDLGAVDEH